MLEWVKSENHSSDHHNTSTGFAYNLYMRTYKYYINYVMLITLYAWQSHVIFSSSFYTMDIISTAN